MTPPLPDSRRPLLAAVAVVLIIGLVILFIVAL